MGNIHDIEQRIGIPITDKRIPGGDVVELMKGVGVHIGRDAIYNVRSGRKSGNRIAAKFEMKELLGGTTSKKDNLYFDIARAGMDVRTSNRRGHYSVQNFASGIANLLGISEADVNRCLRTMRTEMAFSSTRGEVPQLLDYFCELADKYFTEYGEGYVSSPNVGHIDTVWDRESVSGFYSAFGERVAAPHALRTWMPYEIDALRQFYQQRIEGGSHLSALDNETLEKNIKGNPLIPMIASIRQETGVPYDQVTHFTHTNALLFGQPTNPQRTNGNGHRFTE